MGKRKQGRRSSGEGSPVQQPNGRWKAVHTVSWDSQTKKRKTNSETFDIKADALAWLAQKKVEKDSGKSRPELPCDMLFADWVVTFLEDVKRDKATNTHNLYRDVLERFVSPTLGRIPLSEIRPMAIRNLLQELEQDYAGTRTLDGVYEITKTCLMAAVKMELIPRNPVSQVSRPKYTRKDIRPFELAEVKAILKQSESHRLHALFVVAFSLGLRQGELFGLEWGDIDFEGATLRIERQAITPRGKLEIKPPKTKAGRRTLELCPEVLEALEERRKTALKESLGGSKIVFPGARGGYLYGSTFAKRHWKPILRQCSVEERGLHHARHTFATHALLNGEALHVVSKILGHASPTVTLSTYSHLVGVSQEEALSRVAKLFLTTPELHLGGPENTRRKSS